MGGKTPSIICRVDIKGDLVFEDLLLYQCEGGVRFFITLRGHEVSDQDTKEPLKGNAYIEIE